MKLLQFILLFILSFSVYAAKIEDDTITVGKPNSTADKYLIFRDANSTQVGVTHTDGNFFTNSNKFLLGNGVDSDTVVEFDIGLGANNPKLFWDLAKQKFRQQIGGTDKDLGTGSGGGGGDNFNNGFTADNNANAEDGTTGWTASAGTFAVTAVDPLEGDQSFTWTPAAQNDTLDSTELDFDKDILKGRACQAEIEYIGGDENLTLKVLNGDDEELGSLALTAHTVSAPESVFFLCPLDADIVADADKGDIYLRIENTGASASALIKWDKSYLGTLKGLSETTLPDTMSASIDSSGAVSSESVDFINGDCVEVSDVATCSFNSGVITVAPSCVVSNKNANDNTIVANIKSITNSEIVIRTTDEADTVINFGYSLICQKQGADAKQSVQVYKSIPKLVENVSELSALVTDGSSTTTVSNENVDWINGNCTNGSTGNYGCTFNETYLNPPNCVANRVQGVPGAVNCTVATSTTGLTVGCRNGESNADADSNFSLFCQKSDSDFRNGKTQNISLAGIAVNSYAEQSQKQVRVEGCSVLDSGGTPTTNSSMCDSWVSSITDSGTGDYTLNIGVGIYSSIPSCFCSVNGTNRGCRVSETSTTTIEVNTFLTSTGAADDQTFSLFCIGRK